MFITMSLAMDVSPESESSHTAVRWSANRLLAAASTRIGSDPSRERDRDRATPAPGLGPESYDARSPPGNPHEPGSGPRGFFRE